MPEHVFQDREGLELVKPGDYMLGIESAKITLAKSTGNEQVEVIARPIARYIGGKCENINNGTPVYWYGGFTEKQQWGIDVFLKAIRKAPKKGEKLNIEDVWLFDNARGAIAWATIGEDEYQGRKKNTLVRWIVTHDAAHPDPAKFFTAPAAAKPDEPPF